jgi:tetratricopeptide (TPR) repeat protein
LARSEGTAAAASAGDVTPGASLRPVPFSLLLGALLLAAPAAALNPPPERSAWVAVRTPHFVVDSDARPAKARDVALELERMISALAQVVPLAARSYQPTEVYLFASDSEFEATCGAAAGRSCSGLAGLFLPGRYGDYVLVSGERSEQARAVACHELTHAFVRNSSPYIPLWLNEGLAEFWGSFSVVGKDVRIGRPDEDHLALLRKQGLLPLATVLGVTYESPEYNVPARRPAFYAQAWLLTHYLLLGKPDGRAMLGRYLARLQAGVGQEEAFRAAFGESSEQLNKDLYGYTQRSRMSAMSLPIANLAVAEPEKARPLPRDEALARLAQPIFDCPSCNPQACRPLLDEARRLNPKSQLANALLAALLGKTGSDQEAAALFEEVTAAGASPALPLVLHQDFILHGPMDQAAGGLTADAAEVAHARELAQAALALEPDYVPALIGLGTSYLLVPGEDAAPGIRSLERALDLAPARSEAAVTLAQLLARSGQPARADEVVQRFVATSSDPRVRAQAPELLAAVALGTANLAASEGRYDEAAKGFEAALAASRDPARRTTIRATLQRLRDRGDFKAAVELYNHGDSPAALAAVEKLIPTLGDPSLRAEAVRLRDHILSLGLAPATSGKAGAVEQLTPSPDSDRAIALRREADAQREAERYNQAVALANRREFPAALAIAEDLAAHATNATVKTAAAGLRDRLRDYIAGRR